MVPFAYGFVQLKHKCRKPRSGHLLNVNIIIQKRREYRWGSYCYVTRHGPLYTKCQGVNDLKPWILRKCQSILYIWYPYFWMNRRKLIFLWIHINIWKLFVTSCLFNAFLHLFHRELTIFLEDTRTIWQKSKLICYY